MDKSFYRENRKTLYHFLKPASMLLLFSGHAPRKTGDEEYPFFADRSFVYYTGIEQADSVPAALCYSETAANTREMLFMLPPDTHAERWNGKRLNSAEAETWIENIHDRICSQRTIKKPCEIEAMRYAETITAEGIKAMMCMTRSMLKMENVCWNRAWYSASMSASITRNGESVSVWKIIA